MSADKTMQPMEARADGTPVSYSELTIEHEKVQIERERLALERERLAAEREHWKSDAELRPRAEGRGIAVSTLVFVSVICVLAGALVGTLSRSPQRAGNSAAAARLEALMSRTATSTNAPAKGESPIVLRALDAGTGRGAYLLILD